MQQNNNTATNNNKNLRYVILDWHKKNGKIRNQVWNEYLNSQYAMNGMVFYLYQ